MLSAKKAPKGNYFSTDQLRGPATGPTSLFPHLLFSLFPVSAQFVTTGYARNLWGARNMPCYKKGIPPRAAHKMRIIYLLSCVKTLTVGDL